MQAVLAGEQVQQSPMAFGRMAFPRAGVVDQRLGDPQPIHLREKFLRRGRALQARRPARSDHGIAVEKMP